MSVTKARPFSLHDAALAHLLLALACALQLAAAPLVNPNALAVLFALGKSAAYVALLQGIIRRSGHRFHDFLQELALLSFVAMASFAWDFYAVYTSDPTSLAAMNPKAPMLETLFNCWYFSVLNFSFFGISDIIPVTVAAKALLTIEALMSFLTVMFVLSDFVALQASLKRSSTSP